MSEYELYDYTGKGLRLVTNETCEIHANKLTVVPLRVCCIFVMVFALLCTFLCPQYTVYLPPNARAIFKPTDMFKDYNVYFQME